MKIRTDFVTNSSSSSFIVCFARIVDKEKAQTILDRYNLEDMTVDEVRDEYMFRRDYIGAEWANATIYPVSIFKKHPNSKYIVIMERNEAGYDEDSDYIKPIYDYNFASDEVIKAINEENGFDDVECVTGEGFDG